MSDVFGEARIRIVPDLTGFAAKLEAELGAATALSGQQQRLAGANAAAALGSKNLAEQSKKTTGALLGAGTASAKLDAALLGLRTAAGSGAVIGLGATALAAIVAGKALRQMLIDTASFEQELNTFQATTGATAEQMDAVSAAAERLGADIKLPAVSAADAAVAMTELAKAGLSVQDAIAGSEGVLQLATAAQISNAEAANIAANALNAFGLSGDQAIRVADDLANAANAAQGSISDFGQAFQQSSAVARQVGLSLEDTTALLSLFAKNGLQGSDAGTSLRVALIRLVAPTDKAAAEIKKLGLNIRDAQGNLRPDVFAQFGEATANLTPAARDAAAALIFGQDAIRAVSIGAREGTEGLRLMQFQIDQTGTASDLAGARTKGLAGAFGALQSNLQTLGIEVGGFVSGPLTLLLTSINEGISTVNNLITNIKKLGDIKIPSLNIDVGFKVHLPGGKLGEFVRSAFGLAEGKVAQGVEGPLLGNALFVKSVIDQLRGAGADKAADQLEKLNTQLQAMQQARVKVEIAGLPELADELTRAINKTKGQIASLEKTAKQLDDVDLSKLHDALTSLQSIRDIRIKFGLDTTDVDTQIGQVNQRIFELATGSRTAAEHGIGQLSSGLDAVTNSANNAANALAAANTQIKALGHQAGRLGDELLKLQSEGGTKQQQIAVEQQIVAQQEEIIQANLALPSGTIGRATAIRKAREAKIAAQNTIDTLQGEIKSADEAATNKAKQAAKDAATQADKQTQAFIDQFGRGRQRQLNQAKLAAALTEGVQDDLNVDRAIRRFLRAKIKAIQDRIQRLHLHGAALKTAQAAIRTALDDIDNVNSQITEDIQKRSAQRLESIQLDIDLAQTNKNVKREITLRRKFIAALKEAQSHVKKGTEEWKRLRNRIAEETQAIKELQKAQEKKTDASAQAQFAFLQTQAGFAANLLGNLIPLGATAGLVGGTTGQPRPAGPLARDNRSLGIPAQGRSADIAARSATMPSGPSRSGQARQTYWLERIFHILNNIYRGTGHPEAHHRRRTNPSAMDLDNHH